MIGELTNHLWQSTIFATVAGLLTLAFRKNRAQVRYWLWLSASLKFLIPFSLLISLGNFLRDALAPGKMTAEIAPPDVSRTMVQITQPFPDTLMYVPSAPHTTSWILVAILGVWACGFAGIVLIRLRAWLRLRAAVRASTPIDLPTTVATRSSAGLLEPGIAGFLRPTLILPEGILKTLTPSQLEAVLAHELSHARRRDNLTAMIHMIVEAVFWFYPLVWWIGARLVEERERACDESVLILGGEPREYADAILNVCKHYVKSPLACVSGIIGPNLKRRVVYIMARHIGQGLTPGRKMLLCVAAAVAIAIPLALGIILPVRAQSMQTTAPLPSFEVAAVKPNRSGDGGVSVGMPPGRFIAEGATTKFLIAYAYNFKDFQVTGGPSWINSERYDIDAKIPDSFVERWRKLPPDQWSTTIEQRLLMIQALLADRFKLKLNHQTKDLPVYALAVAKNGPKMLKAKPGDTYPNGIKGPDGQAIGRTWHMSRGQLIFQGQSMDSWSGFLSQYLGRTVLNQTGLKGDYDFTLQWTPDPNESAMAEFRAPETGQAALNNPPTPESSGPSIFTAMQEKLGLKLESQKGPVPILVIEHIERPSEN
jgi:uncharacterized protein (TIGR03435 family)